MKPMFWCDLDNSLISGVQDGNKIIVQRRPGARKFVEHLSRLGEVGLCTHGVREHAEESLKVIGMRDRFSKIICREDLNEVVPGRGPRLGRPGYMFDDFPVGSWLYDLKATALGIGPELWIQVDYFGPGSPDRDGLRKGYIELLKRVRRSA